jgi:hypothetical protein
VLLDRFRGEAPQSLTLGLAMTLDLSQNEGEEIQEDPNSSLRRKWKQITLICNFKKLKRVLGKMINSQAISLSKRQML